MRVKRENPAATRPPPPAASAPGRRKSRGSEQAPMPVVQQGRCPQRLDAAEPEHMAGVVTYDSTAPIAARRRVGPGRGRQPRCVACTFAPAPTGRRSRAAWTFVRRWPTRRSTAPLPRVTHGRRGPRGPLRLSRFDHDARPGRAEGDSGRVVWSSTRLPRVPSVTLSTLRGCGVPPGLLRLRRRQARCSRASGAHEKNTAGASTPSSRPSCGLLGVVAGSAAWVVAIVYAGRRGLRDLHDIYLAL